MSGNFCLSLLFSWWADVHVGTCRYQSNYGHYNSGGSAAAAAAAAGMLLPILLPAPVHTYLKWPENFGRSRLCLDVGQYERKLDTC